MEQSKTRTIRTAMCLIQKPTIGKTAFFLSALTALSLLIGCTATTQTDEPKWNDMYEVRSYQVETITNEIVTTVFICRQTETNKVLSTKMSVVNDDSGYDWDYIDEKNVSKNVNENVIEFQCVDGSCEVKEK